MIYEFTVGNFLSIKEPVTLSLAASGISEFPENTFLVKKEKFLTSASIYGANSSGKSNVIRAMSTMAQLLERSSKMNSTDTFEVTPFLLSLTSKHEPSLFEVMFYLHGIRYRYGFEITPQEVKAEWLFQQKVKAEKALFIRVGDEIELGKDFPEGENLAPKTRSNAFFLSVTDQFNGEISKQIIKWFTKLQSVSGLQHEQCRAVTFQLFQKEEYHEYIVQFLANLGLGFSEVQVNEEPFNPQNLPADMPQEFREKIIQELQDSKSLEFHTLHKQYDEHGKEIGETYFRLREQESSGTNKLFDLIGPFFWVLLNGGILVIDELDAKLHPLLTQALVRLFHSSETNPLHSQLIFATHDTNLLHLGNFRRDQIYFTEKRHDGSTDLYSLLEYKLDGTTVRKDRRYEKDYIQGRYGAIPFIGNLSVLMKEWHEKQKSLTT